MKKNKMLLLKINLMEKGMNDVMIHPLSVFFKK